MAVATEAVAYHEAGHAVAALAAPVLPERVWITPGGAEVDGWDLAGCSAVGEGFRPFAWELAWILAGPVAEVLAIEGAPSPAGIILGGPDLEDARVCLAGAPWIDRDTAVREAFRWTARGDVWPAVERVARALLERQEEDGRRGELTGEEVWRLALPEKSTWGLLREWGQPLRRAFPPCAPGTPGMEAVILRGVVPKNAPGAGQSGARGGRYLQDQRKPTGPR